MSDTSIRKKLAGAGALLFFIGMVTGLWSAAAATGKYTGGVDLRITRQLALAAHLNGLLGGLWMIAVAWSFEYLHYGTKGLRRLALAVAIPSWANWLVTLVASFLGVTGLEYTGYRPNDMIAFFLQTLVVLPTLFASGFWAWGFRGRRDP